MKCVRHRLKEVPAPLRSLIRVFKRKEKVNKLFCHGLEALHLG